jgi:hypothetical protein
VLRNELVSVRSEKRVAIFPVAVARYPLVVLRLFTRFVIPELRVTTAHERVLMPDVNDVRVFSILRVRPERENIEPESASSSARRLVIPEPVSP